MSKIYKVMIGMHVHTDGKTYKAGQKVTSEIDLIQRFPGKFTLVGEAAPPVATRQAVVVEESSSVLKKNKHRVEAMSE